jgi:NADPH:quinone reductase-like Zn-dependent oxidoreductase
MKNQEVQTMNSNRHRLPERMKAALATRYGGSEVIEIKAVPLPPLKPGMVMVRVEASTVNSADARTRGLQVAQPMKTLMRLALGLTKPRRPILGTVYAGTIAALGEGVTRFKVGDRVMGCTPGMRFGCHAQYVAAPQNSAIALMPLGADVGEMASLLFGGTTALFFLEKAGVAPGMKVLIYGASGAVGTMAVQIACHLGMQVAAVCGKRNQNLVTTLGADRFIAYDTPEFKLPGAAYDLVLDAVGKLPKNQALAALKPGGTYATVGGTTVSKETAAHIQQLAAWFTQDKLKPVIQQRFAFEDIRSAHALVDTGHKTGSVVLVVQQEEYQ